MTGQNRAIDEAAAFYDLFLRSDWTSCHVRGGGIELFVARTPGYANPMLGLAVVKAPAAEPAVSTLRAPHLGTLAALAEVGSVLAPGDRYGTVELLDDAIDLVADRAGTISRHLAHPGALIQFDEPLVALA